MTIGIAKNFEHTTSHVLPKIAKGLVAGYDWLTGPAMSEHERVNHELAVTEPMRHFSNLVL